jgi:hypothetical protein
MEFCYGTTNRITELFWKDTYQFLMRLFFVAQDTARHALGMGFSYIE